VVAIGRAADQGKGKKAMSKDPDRPPRARSAQTRLHSRVWTRLLQPSMAQLGGRTVERIGVPPAPFGDAFHYLMRSSWPVFCVAFSAYYLLINVLFGAIYYWDLQGIENARPGSFGDAFMFSVQTIATIGYGHLLPRSTFANAVVVFESMASFLGLSLWTGLAFSRFSRPTAFSTKAVITTDNGVPTLMFRAANGRGNRIVDASMSVTLLKTEVNAEGVEWRRQIDLKLVRARSAAFALSWTVQHQIDDDSPLKDVAALLKNQADLALVVAMVGIDDTFGQPIHAMQYYTSASIKPNARFVDMATTAADGRTILDFTVFDEIVEL
jgi:inward rectifier potassium channel